MIRWPTFVEPVKLILSMPGCFTMASPASGPVPGSTWSTPSGTPASSASSASFSAVYGVSSDGLWMTTLPQASAAAIFHVDMSSGKFHGVITPTTPTGSRSVMLSMPGRAGMVSPILEYTPACAPASAAFWNGDLYFGCLRGERLQRVVIDPDDRRRVVREERLFTNLGRIREVTTGPDGALYFSTSNRDGRGSPHAKDDRIFRVK